jgi:hypothetical protein
VGPNRDGAGKCSRREATSGDTLVLLAKPPTVGECEGLPTWKIPRGSGTCTSGAGVPRFEQGLAEIHDLLGQAEHEGSSWGSSGGEVLPLLLRRDHRSGRRRSSSSRNETVTSGGSTGGRVLDTGCRVLRPDGRGGQTTSKAVRKGMTEAASHPLGVRPRE